MAATKYSFIIKAPGYTPGHHNAEISSPVFHSTIVGVEDVDQAIIATDGLRSAGVEIIELCGGFTAEEARRIQDHVGSEIAVGLVSYSN